MPAGRAEEVVWSRVAHHLFQMPQPYLWEEEADSNLDNTSTNDASHQQMPTLTFPVTRRSPFDKPLDNDNSHNKTVSIHSIGQSPP